MDIRVNKWPTSEITIKIVVSENFCPQTFSERGSKFSSCSGVSVPKQALQMGMVAILFLHSLLGWLLVGVEKSYKTRFLCHPLLEMRRRVKRRERPEVKNTTICTLFLGGLKLGRK